LRAALADGWRPDVITSQEPWEEGLVAQILARRYAARDVPQLHFDIMSDRWRNEAALNGLKRLLARRVITRAAHVRVVSEPLKRSLIDRWKIDADRISVTPVGVNFHRSTISRELSRQRLDATLTDERVVLFVGRLVAAKNLTLWLEVAKRVLASCPTTRFVLVGDGELRASLEERARELGISASVRFIGSRAHSELPDIYAAADVFLLTSHYEGFGRVVLESMLAGRPVVTTRCGGPEDLVKNGHNGFLVARDDAETLAARVCDLLANTQLAAEVGARGARLAEERFGLQALADRLVDMWQRA
jgi:glycosyltransferase involved in cell wall biosynthesis